MLKSTVSVLFILLAFYSNAQQVQWLRSSPVKHTSNPHSTSHIISSSGNNVYIGRLDTSTILFGSDVYGFHVIDCYDTLASNLKWSFSLGPKAMISDLHSDINGNVFILGSYMETLSLNAGDTLLNTGTGFNINFFLIILDQNGSMVVKRNLTLTYPSYINTTAVSTDANGFCWYVINNFNQSRVIQIDQSGNDLQFIDVNGIRLISSISFDEFNNLFIAGATESGSISIGNLTEIVTDNYMMFLARVDSSGNPSWIRLAHDVTFQHPQVAATINGSAFLGGNLMDSTTWGNLTFNGPQWVYAIFLTLVDSSGNFQWGVEAPQTPSITGDIQAGNTRFIDADEAGNLYVSGSIRGTVDWGNGVISNSDNISLAKTSIIIFDKFGAARWCINGGASIANTTYNLHVTSQDHLYFASGGQDTIRFEYFTTNEGGGNAIAFGKIDPAVPTSIKNISLKNFSFIYPNPLSGNALHFINPFDHSCSIIIFEITGKKIFQKDDLGTGVQSLNIEQLGSGVYYYKVILENSDAYSGKLIKTN